MRAAHPEHEARDALRDQLREAARRELVRADPGRDRRRRRRRWRGVGFLVAVLLGATVTAGATDLISIGTPLPDTTSTQSRLADQNGGLGSLALKAPDPDGGLAWGVSTYTAPDGKDCALAGQVRGVSLGRVRAGQFRRYENGTTGACGNLSRMPMFSDSFRVEGGRPLTIIYGRVAAAQRLVSIDDDGRTRTVATGPGGAFLFVLGRALRPDSADLRDLHIRVGR
jgi:hypothetical protein